MSPTSYRAAPSRDDQDDRVTALPQDVVLLADLPYPLKCKWWRLTGSNRRPSACKADALPAELSLPIPQLSLGPKQLLGPRKVLGVATKRSLHFVG